MERVTRDNSAVCLIDHQVGLLSGVRDITINEFLGKVVHQKNAIASLTRLKRQDDSQTTFPFNRAASRFRRASDAIEAEIQ
jgi:hypothetical protein